MADLDPGPKRKLAGPKPDLATFGGVALAFAGILGGLLLEGGKIQDVAQVTAAMIVCGGTLGAVMVTTPLDVLLRAFRRLPDVFLARAQDPGSVLEALIEFATRARKQGIVSLENEAAQVPDAFLRKAMNLAVDGTDIEQLRKMMESEIAHEEQAGEAEAKVYEAAGGYAPTIGIIGAVLGLIQVMKHIENTAEVGKGIAVAFVATVYGVGIANLFLLPAANKLKARLQVRLRTREMMLEGVTAIVEGLNPKLIRLKLEAYAPSAPPRRSKAGGVPKAMTEPRQA
jgi:chemotaxis protein MotA